MKPETDLVTRRDLIQIAVAAAAGMEAQRASASDSALKFFSRDEFAMVDELSELIIPADDHSPGARAAGVAAYLDGSLADSREEQLEPRWHDGLKRINALCRQMHGHAFMESTQEQRVALLSRIAKNETDPEKPEERFFIELKYSTAHAYYSSKIGIHQEMEYKGNVPLQQFVGYQVK